MKNLLRWIATTVIISSVLAFRVTGAESVSLLLQRGIFAEETEGNLDAAIKIYEQIAMETAANRTVVAQAQYRLGVCHHRKGSKAEAIRILNDLLTQFPAEAALGQKAREVLSELGQSPSNNITIRKLSLMVDRIHSISQDGKFIAYRPKNSFNVVIFETATGNNWTAIKGSAGNSAWNALISPDGRQIAYEHSEVIHIARIDGSGARMIHTNKNVDLVVVISEWSPDGGQLIVSSWDRKSASVAMLDVTTGKMKEIKRWDSPDNLGEVHISSNGRYLASRAGIAGENRRKIFLIDLESLNETTLVEQEVRELVGWSPGDGKVLFSSSRTGTTGLWAITVRDGKASGDPELVKANLGEMSPQGITHDGTLYYAEDKSSEAVYLATADFQTGEILGKPRRVTDRFSGLQTKPVWSKNGEKLMLAVDGGQKRFVAVTLNSGEEKEFPVSNKFSMPLQQHVWSPDSAFLLVQCGNAAGQHGIHRYDLSSGTVETLITQVQGAWSCNPRFAPEGSSFYYARRIFSKDDWKDSIVRRDLPSGREAIVYESPEKFQISWPFELSPDGRRLAIVASDQFRTNDFVVAIKVRSVSGSENQEVARMAPRESLTSLSWTPDGKRLVYTKEASGKVEVWSTGVDSGQPVELKFSMPNIRNMTVHPNGREVTFRAGSREGQDLWVMEGLLTKPSAQAPHSSKQN